MEPGLETAGASWAEGLAAPAVRELRAYDPGHDLVALRRRDAATGVIELGSNENPYGPSPRALEAATAALGEAARQSVVEGKGVSVRVEPGGWRILKKKKK